MQVEKLTEFTDDAIITLWEAFDGYYDFYRIALHRQTVELWKIDNGDAYSVTRIEHDRTVDSTTLVVCLFAGKNIRQWARHVINAAERKGWNIRMHTHNETIAKLMQRNYQFNAPEFVLLRNTQNGRSK